MVPRYSLWSAVTRQHSRAPLWSIPLPAGEPRRLGSIEVAGCRFLPGWPHPLAKGTDLYVADKDGSNPRKLVSVSDDIYDPSVSPDGKRIVFTMSICSTVTTRWSKSRLTVPVSARS